LSSIAVSPRTTKLNWSQLYLCVGLTTLATLLLELALTRIFSVVFYYHFAFLAISIALFGLGAGGVFSYVVADKKGNLFAKLGQLSALNSLLVVFALAVVVWQRAEMTNLRLAVIYFTTALPFFVSGTIVSLAISEGMERVDRVYFFDLLGAQPTLRTSPNGSHFTTDSGHYIIDARFEKGITEPVRVQRELLQRVGIIETGLFLGLADTVIVAADSGVRVMHATTPS